VVCNTISSTASFTAPNCTVCRPSTSRNPSSSFTNCVIFAPRYDLTLLLYPRLSAKPPNGNCAPLPHLGHSAVCRPITYVMSRLACPTHTHTSTILRSTHVSTKLSHSAVSVQARPVSEGSRFQDNRHLKVVSLSAIRTGRLYLPGNIPGTHFYQRLSRPQGRRFKSMKTSNYPIGNRKPSIILFISPLSSAERCIVLQSVCCEALRLSSTFAADLVSSVFRKINPVKLIFMENSPLCLIIYKVNKLFVVAVKHSNSIFIY
jgi:hypothetical protein